MLHGTELQENLAKFFESRSKFSLRIVRTGGQMPTLGSLDSSENAAPSNVSEDDELANTIHQVFTQFISDPQGTSRRIARAVSNFNEVYQQRQGEHQQSQSVPEASSTVNTDYKTRLEKGRFHLRYIVLGFLEEKAKTGCELDEKGNFPSSLKWWKLFIAGITVQDARDRCQGDGMRRLDSIPSIDNLRDITNEEYKRHSQIVEGLRKLKNKRYTGVVAMCQDTDDTSVVVPWKSLLPPRISTNPTEINSHQEILIENGQEVVIRGPISCVKCDCIDNGNKTCRFEHERAALRNDRSFTVGWGNMWCNKALCNCPSDTIKVMVDERGACLCSQTQVWGEVQGAPPLPPSPITEPLEANDEHFWPIYLLSWAKSYKPRPQKKRGRKPGSKNKKTLEKERMEARRSEGGGVSGVSRALNKYKKVATLNSSKKRPLEPSTSSQLPRNRSTRAGAGQRQHREDFTSYSSTSESNSAQEDVRDDVDVENSSP